MTLSFAARFDRATLCVIVLRQQGIWQTADRQNANGKPLALFLFCSRIASPWISPNMAQPTALSVMRNRAEE